MSESIPIPANPPNNPERYKILVVILTVLTTVVTAIVAGLQADANIRASTSNRDSQIYAILASGELQRQGLQAAYDLSVFSSYLKDSQEALVLQVTALEQEQAGDQPGAAASRLQASVSRARAEMAQKFSVFLTDPRYAPGNVDEMPDMQAYLDDSFTVANELLSKQNASADEYDRWNRKSDAYTSVLTILAVSFFLFGLAQALSPRLRLLFACFGMSALASAGFWMLLILIN